MYKTSAKDLLNNRWELGNTERENRICVFYAWRLYKILFVASFMKMRKMFIKLVISLTQAYLILFPNYVQNVAHFSSYDITYKVCMKFCCFL